MGEGYTEIGTVLTEGGPEGGEGVGVIVVSRFSGASYSGVRLSSEDGRRNLYLAPPAALRLAILLGSAAERDVNIR